MSSSVRIEIEIPDDLARFRLPDGAQERLQMLLDKQHSGQPMTYAVRHEAERLVDLSGLLCSDVALSGRTIGEDPTRLQRWRGARLSHTSTARLINIFFHYTRPRRARRRLAEHGRPLQRPRLQDIDSFMIACRRRYARSLAPDHPDIVLSLNNLPVCDR